MTDLSKVFTALVTPFKNQKVDYASLEKLVDHQVRHGIEGFVINGTTAESPTLTPEERDEIFRFVRRRTEGKISLVMGTGSNSTAHTIEATRDAEKIGADGVLVVVPYYNKPPQRGLFAHFKAVAESTTLPVILYNVPGRTITSLTAETVKELSGLRNVVGIKEATGNIDLEKEIVAACPKSFVMLSGDDGTYAEFLANGGHGVISVASHIIPSEFAAWTKAARTGDFAPARAGIEKFKKVIDALFVEANPIPVKKALQLMGLIESGELRLPLVELESDKTAMLREEMRKAGILK